MDQLIALFKAHAWVPLASIIVGFLVRVIKSNKVDGILKTFSIPSIPPRLVPWIALFLGELSGVLDAVVGGAKWSDAIIKGAGAAFMAIAGHQLVVESLRNGKEIAAPVPDDRITLKTLSTPTQVDDTGPQDAA